MHSTHFTTHYILLVVIRHQTYGKGFTSERGNLLLSLHGLIFLISSMGSFICTFQQTGQHVLWYFLHRSWNTGWKRDIAQWVQYEELIRWPITPWEWDVTFPSFITPWTHALPWSYLAPQNKKWLHLWTVNGLLTSMSRGLWNSSGDTSNSRTQVPLPSSSTPLAATAKYSNILFNDITCSEVNGNQSHIN